jgi:hypothetical protein
MNSEILATQYAFNHFVLQKNLDGLSHADSLVQPQPGGNCINWVLGHILANRNSILRLLGASAILSDDQTKPYMRGAAPLATDGAGAIQLEALVEALNTSQETVATKLAQLTPEAFAKPVEGPTGGEDTVGSALAKLQFHEAYHAGQVGILRRLTGRDGVLT